MKKSPATEIFEYISIVESHSIPSFDGKVEQSEKYELILLQPQLGNVQNFPKQM